MEVGGDSFCRKSRLVLYRDSVDRGNAGISQDVEGCFAVGLKSVDLVVESHEELQALNSLVFQG